MKSFQKKYPRAYQLFSILNNGTRRFGAETMLFVRLKNELAKNPRAVESMSWKDANTYREIPRDWKSVSPVMVVASLPMMNWIMLPLAYMYPQKLLCKQFWTPKQHLVFSEVKFLEKQPSHNQVLDMLSEKIDSTLTGRDSVAKNTSLDLIQKVKVGHSVTIEQVLETKTILSRPEFNINNLKAEHCQKLINLHNCSRVFTRSQVTNLEYFAYWLSMEDKKLMAENLEKIEQQYLNSFCFERGINARQNSTADMIKFLKVWLRFSSKLGLSNSKSYTENNYTLYLHGQALLRNSYRQ